MKNYILRDSAEARRFLAQGLWWQRVVPPSGATTRTVLEWVKELASAGQPLPPPGFVADVGHVAFGEEWETRTARAPVAAALPVNLVSTYEDHVLGKVYSDWTFSRASDALRRYARGRDRSRALAFLFEQFREQARFDGVEISPGVVTAALDTPPEEFLNEGWEALRQEADEPLTSLYAVDPEDRAGRPRRLSVPLRELFEALYRSLIESARRTAEVLDQADLTELENGTALDEVSQRLARRQVLRAAGTLEATLPRQKVRPLARRMEVPTRILDEDTYPVGGYTSVSNRGTVESLLHSQLAYMETDPSAERPDLFDIKFLRDELLYYSRDENQFLRRPRTFVLVLDPDLDEARFKEPELPYQNIVLMMALLYVTVRRLTEWLATDALYFKFLFLGAGESEPLKDQRNLVETLLHEGIALQTVEVGRVDALRQVAARCANWARRSMVHCLVVGVNPKPVEADDTVVTRLAVSGPRPALGDGPDEPETVPGDDAMDSWAQALQLLLQRWV
jgi:hypothetical protein